MLVTGRSVRRACSRGTWAKLLLAMRQNERELTTIGGLRWLASGLALVVVACVCFAGALAQADVGQGGDRSSLPLGAREAEEFPLWMGVPVKRFAVVDEGTVRQRRWGVFAFRKPGADGGDHLCLNIGTFYLGASGQGTFQTGEACSLPTNDGGSVLNESGFSIQKQLDGPVASDTVVGAAVGAGVARVRLVLRPGPAQMRATRRLSIQQSRKARVHQFRYVAFGVARKACVQRLVGFDAQGKRLFAEDSRDCDI
jgi:hypothetical protein